MIRVNRAAPVKPNMMVTAIEAKNGSISSGIMPRTVVMAPMLTGRRRLTPDSTMASKPGFPAPSCAPISSTSTIAFLICMPIRLSSPSRAMKPNGCPVTSRPRVTPIIARGTVRKITSGFFSELNRMTQISTMARNVVGNFALSAPCASREFSYSPPHSIV